MINNFSSGKDVEYIEREKGIKIEVAKEEDIDGILFVQNSVLLKNTEFNQAGEKGFLVYSTTADELKDIISYPENIVLCAKDDERVIGYILAYDLDN